VNDRRSDAEPPREGLELSGLSGDNPLAFLAALGTLRVLSDRWPGRDVRMSWRLAGTWRPILHANGPVDRPEVVGTLDECLRGRDRDPQFTLTEGEDQEPRELTLTASEFAEVAAEAGRRATRDDRVWADFCAAYGTDAFEDGESIRDSALRFTSGQQSFLGSIRELAVVPVASKPTKGKGKAAAQGAGTAAHHIDQALFETWSYADPRPSLRWDPIDDRRYALRAFNPTDPSASPIQTVRGANRLAVEALPWLPTFPCAGGAKTRGFSAIDREVTFSWPIWGPPLAAATARSLLGLSELVIPRPRPSLRERGIVEIFRSRRVGGYYRNFSPGVASWGIRGQSAGTA
jgi:hypothetical protein